MKRGLSKTIGKAVALATAITTMSIGMVGCSDDTKKDTSKNDLQKIDVFSMTANYAGEQTGWFGKIVKDKFGLDMNIISSNLQGGDSKFATMMASGNLGDIVVFGADDQKYRDAIKAGLLLDWNKDGLLDKYGTHIKEFQKAIEKNKTNFGDGKAVYGLGHGVSTMPATSPSEGTEMTYEPTVRWDLYQKLGKPTINTVEDYLPLLKKMQEANPKSDSGKPTYAFSMWSDWDGNMMMLGKQFACMQGYDELGFLLVHGNEDKYQDILDPNGYYLKTLKLYYEANKMGLVDPDSISQKYDDASNKMKDGQILFSWFPFFSTQYNTQERVNKGQGFKLVPFNDEKVYSNGFANYGANQVIAIGAKAKNPEKIMQFIDWLYSPEGVMTSTNGPKGLTWDIKDGKTVFTDFGKRAVPSTAAEQVSDQYGGGTYKDGINALNFQTVNPNSVNPDTKEPYNWQLWSSTLNDNVTPLDKSWRETLNATNDKDYFVKNNKIVVSPVTNVSDDALDSATQQKMGQIATVIKQNSWKMVFAKSDSEFASLQKDMIEKSKGLGYDDVVKFYGKQAEKRFAARKNLK
ncbi:ABC transporter substrate-binding protein [Clostridium sp. YIM B02505]|uniref:ABC transporter substrate-binding protein n=1 Tax=Clostridium yunnanense TaxID=2800325 RepID=A0ABS1ELE1_9CLOT|nr:extracellular solute-binding protein [Clostridium yunnanense]MBK1810187.1 ABC transporter substrate-binding protein [Clostridium yunnanense]